MFKHKKRIKIIVFLLMFLTGSYFSVVQWVLPDLIVKVHPALFSLFESTPGEIEFDDIRFENEYFTFESFDNLKLKGHIVFSVKYSTTTIILIHGIRSRKENYFERASKLAEEGFNVVTFDLRGHGESEGDYCTFGVKERVDIQSLIEVLSKQYKLNSFVLWGQSLGGAVVLQSMNIDDRIRAGIAESTFTDFETIATDYIQNTISIFPDFICAYSISIGAKNAKFDPKEASPLKSSSEIYKPMLFVHGNQDRNINIEYGKENFENCPSENKKFIEVEDASHNNVWEKGGSIYFNKVVEFISKLEQ